MTITSNIHVGLAAWTNHTFTLGEDCSNAGNAYRCITAGTSTAAPTGTSADVDNGGAAHFKWLSAIDFTSYNAWWTAITSPTTQPVVGQIWNHGVFTATLATPIMSFTGKTTTSTNNITLTCAPGESFRDVPGATLAFNASNGVAIQLPASGTGSINYVDISNNNFILDGIQFKDPNSTSGSTIISVSGSGCRIQNCIIDGFTQSTSGGIIFTTGFTAATGLVIENILLIDRATTDRAFAFEALNATDTVRIVNCTGISTTVATIFPCFGSNSSTSSTFIIRNCAVFGYQSAGGIGGSLGTAASAVVDHCVSDATGIGSASTDGGSNLFSKTAANQFVSATTNFKLKAGADCINAGVVDTTDIPSGDDVFRTARGATWDVGAFELISAFSVTRDVGLPAALALSVIRDLGTVGPFSLDFSPDFGSGGTGIDSSFSATIISNSIILAEFQRSLTRDYLAPMALGMAPRADAIIPEELSGGIFVTANSLPQIEWKSTAAGWLNLTSPEWRSAFVNDNPALIEWRAAWVVDQVTTIDAKLTIIPSVSIMPIHMQMTPVSISQINIDWSAPIGSNTIAPYESNLTARSDYAIPTATVASQQRDDALVFQFLPTILRDDRITFESGLSPGAITRNDLISIEWKNATFADVVNIAEWRAAFFRDTIAFPEWSGSAPSYGDIIVNVEFGGGVAVATPIQPEIQNNLASDLAVVNTMDQATVTDSVPVSEYILTIIGENFVFPDSNTYRPTIDNPIAIEWSSNFITEDTAFAAEWQRAAFVDIAGTSSWAATITSDTQALIDTGITLHSTFQDDSIPIEWKLRVLIDVVIDQEQWFGRDTIGSQLEPDEWEKERE
jgi:hypothetical protein